MSLRIASSASASIFFLIYIPDPTGGTACELLHLYPSALVQVTFASPAWLSPYSSCPCPTRSDGLHLSASGNDVLYARVCEVIASCSPNLKPECAPTHFPLWAALAEEGSAAALIPSTSSAYGNSDAHKKRRALDSE